MSSGKWLERVGGIAGVLFVVMFLSDIAITPGEPDEGSTAGKIASYYVSHRSGVLAVSALHALAGVFFLVFVAVLVQRLRGERHDGLARLAGYAGMAAAAVALMSYVCAGAAAYLAGRGATAGTVQALAELRYVSSTFADVPLAVFIAAASAALLPGAVGRRWVSWLGFGAAAALLLGVGGVYNPASVLGLFGFLGSVMFAIWILVGSLLRVPRERLEVAAAAA